MNFEENKGESVEVNIPMSPLFLSDTPPPPHLQPVFGGDIIWPSLNMRVELTSSVDKFEFTSKHAICFQLSCV